MRTITAIAVGSALAALAARGSSDARANGRPPLTNGIRFAAGDDRTLYVASTFGLLVSHDDGCSFRWVCEQNLGYGGTFDPKYRIAADGAIFATTFTGLRVSRDGGCSFTTATANLTTGDPGRIADRWIDAIDIGPTGEVWIATADSGKPNNVYRSIDNGATFEPRGMLSQAIWWKSLAVAPSRAQRVYATGYQVAGALADGGQLPPTAHFDITDDAGATWTESPLAGVAFGSTPLVYAVGVDRANPDIVLMSSIGANPPTGDRLYRSSDGGRTWTEALATTGAILDVAIEATGGVIIAATGGAFESADRGATFAPMAGAPQLACVGQRGDGQVFGCAANWAPDNAAVVASSGGAAWRKVFQFAELAGPVDCPAGTGEQDSCGPMWPSVQQQFGATGPAACVGADLAAARRPSATGCCEAGAIPTGELGALAMLAGLTGAIVRRRRRAYRVSSSSSVSRQLG
jgi:hypothetical protein